jgi:UDP-N-acetylmuramoylalanine--D-glutamate ligase
MIDLRGKRILIVGLGESGAEAARVAAGLGAAVRVVDSSTAPTKAGMVDELESAGVEVDLGIDMPGGMRGYDLLVASPGVPDAAPVLRAARELRLKVISELELGYGLLEGHTMVAVTGTNGKTTTTRLLGDMLSTGGRRAVTCGNIGNPLVGLFGKVERSAVLVVEVSSFQLQNIERFHARVSLALNIAPDHFDWHRDFTDYREAKMRLVENMRPDEYLVYNLDDEHCRQMARRAGGITLGFAAAGKADSAVWVEGGWITAGQPLAAGKVLPLAELKLSGEHNVENVMAAAAAALALGVETEGIREAAGRFEGLEHRVEFVAKVSDVSFFNDSKATNPHAALHAIQSFEQPLVAIMGGRNKGLDFSDIALEVCRRLRDGRVRGLVLVGESADEISESVERACRGEANGHMLMASDLDDSVDKAFRLAGGSGVVLFTPACASFDMFADYKDRGRAFKESVARFKERGNSGWRD